MKKFAALFATVLVMALSATSVFAAASVTLNENVATNMTGTTTTNAAVAAFDTNTLGVTLNDAKEDALAELPTNAASAEIVGVAEVSYTGTIPAEGVAITLNVTGISAGDNVYVIHYTGATTYEKLAATAGNGTVTATFTSLSPVAVVKYTVATTPAPAPQPQAPSYNYDDEPVSPKTGVLPVAAIAAGICLAGAAVCGKKVKFN